MRGRSAWVVAAVSAVALAPACARQGAPRGGEPDILPPVVVATRPDTFEQLDGIDDPIRIEFSERISERPRSGTMDEAVLVSPLTGEVRVDKGRSALEVDLSGGFRPGLVYTVTVLPVVQDMFNNALEEPFEFVFSTGGELVPTAAAGMVLDRITGLPVEGARVVARQVDGDTALVWTTLTDTSGIWTLRYLPRGRYEVAAFLDRDRDLAAGSFEVQGRRVVELADTVLANLVILEPDTLPARLATAEVLDSMTLRLAFDDWLDPEARLRDVDVDLVVDSTTPAGAPPPPAVVRVLHAASWAAWQDSAAQAAADTAAADTAAEAEREPPGRFALGGVERAARDVDDEGLLGEPLPAQELFARLGSPLPAGVPYRVEVAGVENIAGLEGGGGSRIVVWEPPAPDTTAAPPDTAGAAADSAGAAPDTAGVATDTAGVVPDTTSAPPDTGRVARRTSPRPRPPRRRP